VPRAALESGIAACLFAAEARLGEARALVDGHLSLTLAAIALSFAIEEFGKAVMLRAASERGDDPVTLRDFYDHAAKIEAAEEAIGALPLVAEGAFAAEAFAFDAFNTDIPLTLEARLTALYVDWRKGTWKTGIRIDDDVLLDSVRRVEQAILDAKIRWSRADERRATPEGGAS
jgi:AbiV family abortive infection protein